MTSLGPTAAEAGGGRQGPHPSPPSVAASSGLTSEELKVWRLIPHGHANAIKQKYLAAQCGMSTRVLQRILKRLTEDHGLPIVSSCSPPYGVFIPATAEEVDAFVGQLASRALSCQRRIVAVKASAGQELADAMQAVLPLRPAGRPEEPCTVRSRAPRRCLTCRTEFPAWRKDRKFCSDKCRMIYHGRAAKP